MKRLIKLLPALFLFTCGEPPGEFPPFIQVVVSDPAGFVAPLGETWEVTTSAILNGNPISNTNEILDPSNPLPSDFTVSFSEQVRGQNVTVEVQGFSNGVSVFTANGAAVAGSSELALVARFCGDNALDDDRSETCDDGPNNSDITPDACRSTCLLAACGDAIVDSGEGCDDGNTQNGDGCRSDCSPEVCGDGLQDPQEQCDDANLLDNDGCDSDCIPTEITQITAGEAHTCVLFRTQKVRCWGANESGQLGYGNTNNIGDDEPASAGGDVNVGGDVVQISAGNAHTCAVLSNGNVRCWGDNTRSQLGYSGGNDVGDDEPPSDAGDIEVGGFVVQVATGALHTCALLDGGAVRCWGFSPAGALGYPTISLVGDNETPASVGNVDIGGNAVQISASGDRTCVVLATGNVRCWGAAANGLLGLGFGTNNNIGDNEAPAFAPAILALVSTSSAAIKHTCALLVTGNVTCWGEGALGRLGYGNTNNIGDDEPVENAGTVNIGGNVIALSSGGNHSCAVLSGGAVRCWGAGALGVLGYGNVVDVGDNELPSAAGNVDVGESAAQLASGLNHTCAVLENSRVRCWGNSNVGQLGYGDQITIGDNEPPSVAGDVPLF